jgi:hypothetical protein
MPQQRAMLAMQQQKAEQDRQQQAFQNQQAVLQQQQLGQYRQHEMSNQDLQFGETQKYHQQQGEYQQGEIAYRNRMADAANERANRPAADSWEPNWEAGYAFNKSTGEARPLNMPQGQSLGQGGMSKINPTAALNAVLPIIAAGMNNTGFQTNSASAPLWQNATNIFSRMGNVIAPMPGQQAQGQQAAQQVPQQASPSRTFTDKTGRRFIYKGQHPNPAQDQDPNSWQETQ